MFLFRPDYYNRNFTNAKLILRWRDHSDANGISRCKPDPIEGTLRVRQARTDLSNHIGIGRHAKAKALDCTFQPPLRPRHQVNVYRSAGPDVCKLRFTEV